MELGKRSVGLEMRDLDVMLVMSWRCGLDLKSPDLEIQWSDDLQLWMV